MRKREDILKHWGQTKDGSGERFCLLEVLLDIRDLLQPVNQSANENLKIIKMIEARMEADK